MGLIGRNWEVILKVWQQVTILDSQSASLPMEKGWLLEHHSMGMPGTLPDKYRCLMKQVGIGIKIPPSMVKAVEIMPGPL